MKIFRNIKWALPITLVFALLVVGVVLAADVTIDSFDEGVQSLSATTSIVYGTVDHTSILGGERDASLERISGTNATHLEIDTGNDNRLSFTAGSGNQSRTEIVWDGDDSDATTIDYDGLGGSSGDGDLLDGTNDGVVITIVSWDGNEIDVTVTVYEDQGANSSDYCSDATLELRGGSFSGSPTYALSFDDDFSQCGGASNAVGDFGNTGAIVLEIATTGDEGDLVLDMSIVSQTRDLGDLPSDYGITTEANNGARHSKSATYFGTTIEEETDGQPSTNADGDGSEEDGVTRPSTQWANGTDGGHVHFEIISPMINDYACVDGWIDWNDDNDFDDTDEHIIDSLRLYDLGFTDNLDQDFDVPANIFDSATPTTISFYARWRIAPDTDGDGDCSDETDMGYDGHVKGGEVEDYLWEFNDPTAITLTTLEAENNTPILIAAAALLLVLVSGGAVLAYKRYRA